MVRIFDHHDKTSAGNGTLYFYQCFQTWNNRWFVLHANELKYYKHSNSKSPIRVLDLNECQECEMDSETYPEKKNTFR